jgi:hypothetical protein
LVWWSITLTLTVYRPIAANPTNCGAWPNQVGESPHLAETAPAKCYAAGCGSTRGTERHREKHRRASGNPTGVQSLDHLLPTPPLVERSPTCSVNPNTLPDTTPAKCCAAGGGSTILLERHSEKASPCRWQPDQPRQDRPTAADPTTRGAQSNPLGEPQHLAETASAKCCAAISARPFFGDGTAAALRGTGLLTSPCFRPPALVPPATAAVPVPTRPAEARPNRLLPTQSAVEHSPTSSVNPNTLPKLHRQSVVPLVADRPFC